VCVVGVCWRIWLGCVGGVGGGILAVLVGHILYTIYHIPYTTHHIHIPYTVYHIPVKTLDSQLLLQPLGIFCCTLVIGVASYGRHVLFCVVGTNAEGLRLRVRVYDAVEVKHSAYECMSVLVYECMRQY
jgi:hypothetical protein